MKYVVTLIAALLLLGSTLARIDSEAPGSFAPRFEETHSSYRPSDLALLDRRGRVLDRRRTDARRRRFAWVELRDVSPALVASVIASEDRRFYRNDGVDYPALLSAAARWAIGGPPRGASTISMQLGALLRPELRRGAAPRSLSAKVRQMSAAWRLEEAWTKDRILEAYLNLVTFRGEIQGIGAAAAVLLGKAPHGLNEVESAVLAALIRSPNAGPADVERRARAVLVSRGYVIEETSLRRAVANATGDQRVPPFRENRAPHVARRLLRADTTTHYVHSTLDLDVQNAASSALRRSLLALGDETVRDGAVLVTDNDTGDVLAYVGSSGDLSASPHVDGVLARRQPGSALKPFLYSLAVDRRLLTAASLLRDMPLGIPVAGGLYRPENYDAAFHGLISVRTALASSLNIPAVRTLELLGEDEVVAHLRALGFTGLDEPGSYYGPALALGSAEVSLWEIVNAYRTLANGGSSGALRLTDGGGDPRRRVYSEEAAFVVADILSDREARVMTFGLESPLATRFWTAVKTGTSKDMRDNWCIGFSRRYTVGVWVGNFSGVPMGDVSGVSGAAPVWLEVMERLHRDVPSAAPEPPPTLLRWRTAFTSATEPERSEWFLRGTAPAGRTGSIARHRGRILTPAHGARIALDPEIPAAQQRVLFESDAEAHVVSWVLNGKRIGSGGGRFLWPPARGVHELRLVDAAGRTLDRVAFRVKGTK